MSDITMVILRVSAVGGESDRVTEKSQDRTLIVHRLHSYTTPNHVVLLS